jgi:restriction system protein
MKSEPTVWGIHSTDDSVFLDKASPVIAIAWEKLGDWYDGKLDREQLKKKLENAYPDGKKGAFPNWAGILMRFAEDMKEGDYVVFPSKADRKINIGQIIGPHYYDPSESSGLVNKRAVKWLKKLPRTAFSQGSLYEVGSALTLFQVKNYADEFIAALEENKTTVKPDPEEEKEAIAATVDTIEQTTADFILKELSRHYKGYDFELFVASVLNAMGYKTTLSAKGGDSGVDIIAYKDELPPRILVQVKSTDSDIQETTIQSLKGALREGDYGLFVTLSDYAKKAKAYLAQNPCIRAVNGSEFVELVLKYYEVLPTEDKKHIPLKKVFIPIPAI